MQKSEQAYQTITTIDDLYEKKFFQCFGSFFTKANDIKRVLGPYVGGHAETIKSSVGRYFFDIYKSDMKNRSSFRVGREPKPGGVHSGIKCPVEYDSKTEYFFVKVHRGGPTAENPKGLNPATLREIFCYALLEKINMGPEAHFPVPIPGRGINAIYIATKKILGLHHMEDLTSKTKNIKVSVVLMILMNLYFRKQ